MFNISFNFFSFSLRLKGSGSSCGIPGQGIRVGGGLSRGRSRGKSMCSSLAANS